MGEVGVVGEGEVYVGFLGDVSFAIGGSIDIESFYRSGE